MLKAVRGFYCVNIIGSEAVAVVVAIYVSACVDQFCIVKFLAGIA